jgi:hypothetical protein
MLRKKSIVIVFIELVVVTLHFQFESPRFDNEESSILNLL